MVSNGAVVLTCVLISLLYIYKRRNASRSSKPRETISSRISTMASLLQAPSNPSQHVDSSDPKPVQVVLRFLDLPPCTYKEGKAQIKAGMKGLAYRTEYPVHLTRMLQIECENSCSEPTRGYLLGDGRFPDLRSNPPRSLQDLRELIFKLIYLTCTGNDSDFQSWCPAKLSWMITRTYEHAYVPVWWPEDVDFKDPNKMKGAKRAVIRRNLSKAVVRCYHLFNQLDMLDDDLRELAAEVVPRVAPGELPVSNRMLKLFYEIYMGGSPELGIDE